MTNLCKKLKSKKILFITHTYHSFIKDQLEEIARYFEEVYVIVRYKPIAEIANLLPISFLKTHRKKYAIDLENVPGNVKVFTAPVWYFPTDLGYSKLGRKHYNAVMKVIEREALEFDLIHSHFAWSAGYVGLQLKKKYGIPFILTTHGYDIYDLPKRNTRWKDRIKKIIDSADLNITVGEGMLKYYKELGVNVKKIRVIENGFLRNLFFKKNTLQIRKKLGIKEFKKIILTVGNLVKVKGHKYLIEAMLWVTKHEKDAECLIIGDGSLKGSLQAQIRSNGLEEKVKLLGSKPHSEINDWMNASDLFVLPSISESFGIVQIEAMSCGKPIVATKNGGSEFIIRSEEVGMLCPKKDSRMLANTILNALRKRWNSSKIIKYSERFSWDGIVKKIIIEYLNLL